MALFPMGALLFTDDFGANGKMNPGYSERLRFE